MLIDELLNVDWDGNEFLFFEVFGIDIEEIYNRIENNVEKEVFL